MSLDPVTAVLDIGGKLIDRLWPDPAQRDAAKLEMLKMQQSGELAQMTAESEIAKAQLAVDAAEATNPNVFVSGWRPFIGWTCGAAFAYKFIVAPMAIFGLAAAGHAVTVPPLDISDMTPILLGMLGLGAMRSYEKVKGVA